MLPDGRAAARAVFQAAATATWRLWSFSRLWVAVISRHSESAAEPSLIERFGVRFPAEPLTR